MRRIKGLALAAALLLAVSVVTLVGGGPTPFAEAATTAQTGNYQEQGGNEWDIGNATAAESGSLIIQNTYGALKFGSTAITISADNLNSLDSNTLVTVGGSTVSPGDFQKLHDITATASEINTPLDGATVSLAEFKYLESPDITYLSGATLAVELAQLDGLTGASGTDLSHAVINSYTYGTTAGHTLADGVTLYCGTTIPQNAIGADDVLRVTVGASQTGGSAAGDIELWLGGASVLTAAFQSATATTAEVVFTVYNVTAATQKLTGHYESVIGGEGALFYGTSSVDFSAGDVAAAVYVESKNGGDTVSGLYCIIEKLK